MEAMIWIGLIILFVVVEIATVGLTSIWFAGGALISLILCLCGVGLGWIIREEPALRSTRDRSGRREPARMEKDMRRERS